MSATCSQLSFLGVGARLGTCPPTGARAPLPVRRAVIAEALGSGSRGGLCVREASWSTARSECASHPWPFISVAASPPHALCGGGTRDGAAAGSKSTPGSGLRAVPGCAPSSLETWPGKGTVTLADGTATGGWCRCVHAFTLKTFVKGRRGRGRGAGADSRLRKSVPLLPPLLQPLPRQSVCPEASCPAVASSNGLGAAGPRAPPHSWPGACVAAACALGPVP